MKHSLAVLPIRLGILRVVSILSLNNNIQVAGRTLGAPCVKFHKTRSTAISMRNNHALLHWRWLGPSTFPSCRLCVGELLIEVLQLLTLLGLLLGLLLPVFQLVKVRV